MCVCVCVHVCIIIILLVWEFMSFVMVKTWLIVILCRLIIVVWLENYMYVRTVHVQQLYDKKKQCSRFTITIV